MSKIGRNDPCPCGSGAKYKKCCYGKPASELLLTAQSKLQQRLTGSSFEQHQRDTQQQMLEAMKANGMDPAYIYAVEKTGIMVFEETMHLLAPEELARWQTAYDEYQSGGA